MSQAPFEPAPMTPSVWPPHGPAGRPNPSRLHGVLSAVLAVLALAVAVAAWFRAAPKPEAAPVYSEQQVAEAKKAVCGAFEKADRTLEIAGQRRGETPTEADVVAVNTRLALASASSYLTNSLQLNPAAPFDLGTSIRELARLYQDVKMTQLADGTREDITPSAHSVDATAGQIKKQCT